MSGTAVPSLGARIEAAMAVAIRREEPELAGADTLVRRSDRPGVDLQSNAALGHAARIGRRPAELADALARRLQEDGEVAVTVSGPGFLNLTLPDAAIWRQAAARLADARLGVGSPQAGRRTVIDYSGVNVAKEMHVGHLRTTVIGDALARVLDHLGAEVVRENHLGDWGTQFGMLIQYLDEHPDAAWRHGQLGDGGTTLSALDALYRAARAVFDAEPDFADRARRRVVALQSGDAHTLAVWREIVIESEYSFQRMYRRLGVLLTPDDSRGESFYNPMLADVAAELVAAGIAVESRGALCVFDPDQVGRDGEPTPLIVRKSDGGFGYAATDLATLRHRTLVQRADRVLYVVDARQAAHFRMVFATARRAGWVPDSVELVHVAFGAVLGPAGRPFATRDGGTVRLSGLVDAAVERAREVVAEKNPALPAAELDRIAELVGIGALRYADLSTSRTRDYVFDPDRMVSLRGDTGVYLQYAYARVGSILRRAGDAATPPVIDATAELHAAERALVLAADGLTDVLDTVAMTLEPHRLCGHLYELARAFTAFFEHCPVLTAPEPVRTNRLALCHLAARTLRTGLTLLGIAAPDRL